MSTTCACPQLPELPVAGTGPVTCVCCGKPLVLTCPGECGTAHVRQSIDRAIATPARPRPKRKSPVYTRPRVYKPRVCRCGATFTPTGPRGDKCPECR